MTPLALEIRDRSTFIPALAVAMNPSTDNQRWLLRRAGYSEENNPRPTILLTRLCGDGSKACCDPYDWRDRTFQVAHEWITKNWESISDGDVIDVEFILGEAETKKLSERYGG